MPAPDEPCRRRARMDEQGENDLKNAAHTLKLAECPTDTVCFHAQQCVEKYLKASLVVLEIAFPTNARHRSAPRTAASTCTSFPDSRATETTHGIRNHHALPRTL